VWERVGRDKLLLRRRLLGRERRLDAHGGGEGRGHIVAAARLQFVITAYCPLPFHDSNFNPVKDFEILFCAEKYRKFAPIWGRYKLPQIKWLHGFHVSKCKCFSTLTIEIMFHYTEKNSVAREATQSVA